MPNAKKSKPTPKLPDSPGPDDRSLFINRELSALEFHRRVIEQAKDPGVPLLERLRFLAISCAILDEFFEIRVGGLREQIELGLDVPEPDGMAADDLVVRIRERVLVLIADQYQVLNSVLLPALAKEGVVIYRRSEWSAAQLEWVSDYFAREVLPVLTPIGLDPAHPFPRIQNKSLNFIVSLSGKDAFGRSSRAAVVQAPRLLPRLIALPASVGGAPHTFVLLSSVIHARIGDLFPGMKVTACDQFRVTRNSDLWVDEEEVEDLLRAVQGELRRRHFGRAVRLEVSDTCGPEMANFLCTQFELGAEDLYRVHGPVNLHRLDTLCDLVNRPDLKYPTFVPGIPAKFKSGSQLFRLLRKRDVLLHHPYQSFTPVLDMVRQAAKDPKVLAIRQTLYRTGAGSPLGDALLEAARAGKEVTVVIELRARFDEAANIELASKLQEAGATVAYGIVGFKAHAKMLLIIRREGNELRRYVHLGTGNYNPSSARRYCDFGLMTADPDICEDVHYLFQQLTGLGRINRLKRLVQTPFDLHRRLLEWIAGEAKNARRGRPARIMAKLNALNEPEVIRALYAASQAGVKIDLVVRGVCCLRPGIPGVSDNIRVRSVVGRFLEHHRVFHFHADGEEVTLLSSADWMPRNLFRRMEVAFPVLDRKHRARVIDEGIQVYFARPSGSWSLAADGSYSRIDEPAAADGTPAASAQQVLLRTLANKLD